MFPISLILPEVPTIKIRKLNAMGLQGRRYLPYIIGDGSAQTLHERAAA
jgi:hypothetical protein